MIRQVKPGWEGVKSQPMSISAKELAEFLQPFSPNLERMEIEVNGYVFESVDDLLQHPEFFRGDSFAVSVNFTDGREYGSDVAMRASAFDTEVTLWDVEGESANSRLFFDKLKGLPGKHQTIWTRLRHSFVMLAIVLGVEFLALLAVVLAILQYLEVNVEQHSTLILLVLGICVGLPLFFLTVKRSPAAITSRVDYGWKKRKLN